MIGHHIIPNLSNLTLTMNRRSSVFTDKLERWKTRFTKIFAQKPANVLNLINFQPQFSYKLEGQNLSSLARASKTLRWLFSRRLVSIFFLAENAICNASLRALEAIFSEEHAKSALGELHWLSIDCQSVMSWMSSRPQSITWTVARLQPVAATPSRSFRCQSYHGPCGSSILDNLHFRTADVKLAATDRKQEAQLSCRRKPRDVTCR